MLRAATTACSLCLLGLLVAAAPAAPVAEVSDLFTERTAGGVTFSPPRHVAHLGPRLPRNPANANPPAHKVIGRPGEQTVNKPVAVACRDGTILRLFERGCGMLPADEKIFPYAFISLARFNLVWLLAVPEPTVVETGSTSLAWQPLPPLPDPLGVAGPFVGSHRGAVVVAGGANFPTADGQDRWAVPKVWHHDVWVLAAGPSGATEWLAQPPLDRPIGYGGSASTPAGVVCIGGEDGTRMFDTVTLLGWDPESRSVTSRALPPLPQPLAFGGATAIGSMVYVVCGQPAAAPAGPIADALRLDLRNFDARHGDPAMLRWEKLPDLPGGPRTHPIVVARATSSGDRVCVFSGRRPDPDEGKGVIEPLRDAWEFDPEAWEAAGKPRGGTTGWRRLADMPAPRMAGTAIPVGPDAVAVLAGDDGRLWSKTDILKDTHPGFPRESLVYDAATDTWSVGGLVPSCQVATTAIPWRGGHALVSGELRPRVRTPASWFVSPAATNQAGLRRSAP